VRREENCATTKKTNFEAIILLSMVAHKGKKSEAKGNKGGVNPDIAQKKGIQHYFFFFVFVFFYFCASFPNLATL